MKIGFPSRLAAASITLLGWTAMALGDEEKPPDAAFERSAFDFKFQIPNGFESTGSGRGYLRSDAGKTAYLDLSWKHDSDSIVVRLFVVPDAAWDKSPAQIFADAKKKMLAAPGVKLLSERDYQVGDCPAHSFLFFRQGDASKFERIDYILTKPDLNVVIYSSPGKAALESIFCQELFQSITVSPKTVKN